MWTNSNTAEWVRGSTLAFSDAISQSELQSFMDTHAIKYLPLPGKPRKPEVLSPGPTPTEPDPVSTLEVDLAEQAKKLPDGDGRSGVDEFRIEEGGLNDGHGRAEVQIEVTAVVPCVEGISATPAATPAVDTVMSEEGSSVVAGNSHEKQVEVQRSAGDTPGVGSGQSALGIGEKAGSTGNDGEPKEAEAENSTGWGTPTLSDINLLSMFWEDKLDAYADTVQPNECENFFFQISMNAYEIVVGLAVDRMFDEFGRSSVKQAVCQSIRGTSRRDLKISPDLCLPYLALLANVYKFPFVDPEMCDLIAQRKFKNFARNDNRRVKFEVSVLD